MSSSYVGLRNLKVGQIGLLEAPGTKFDKFKVCVVCLYPLLVRTELGGCLILDEVNGFGLSNVRAPGLEDGRFEPLGEEEIKITILRDLYESTLVDSDTDGDVGKYYRHVYDQLSNLPPMVLIGDAAPRIFSLGLKATLVMMDMLPKILGAITAFQNDEISGIVEEIVKGSNIQSNFLQFYSKSGMLIPLKTLGLEVKKPENAKTHLVCGSLYRYFRGNTIALDEKWEISFYTVYAREIPVQSRFEQYGWHLAMVVRPRGAFEKQVTPREVHLIAEECFLLSGKLQQLYRKEEAIGTSSANELDEIRSTIRELELRKSWSLTDFLIWKDQAEKLQMEVGRRIMNSPD